MKVYPCTARCAGACSQRACAQARDLIAAQARIAELERDSLRMRDERKWHFDRAEEFVSLVHRQKRGAR